MAAGGRLVVPLVALLAGCWSSQAAVSRQLPSLTGAGWVPSHSLECVAAFLRAQGWSAVEIITETTLTRIENMELMKIMSEQAIFTSTGQISCTEDINNATKNSPGDTPTRLDTLLITRNTAIQLTDRWRRSKNRILITCLGCPDTGFFLRSHFTNVFTAALSSSSSITFFDAKMWNRPQQELPLGTCVGGVLSLQRRPYDDFSVWTRGVLSGVTITIAAAADPPLRAKAQLTHANGTITGGLAGELLLFLQRTLGFSYRLLPVGTTKPWNAMMARVAAGSADVAGALLMVTPQRHRMLRFSQPTQQLRVGVALRKPALRSGGGAVLRPFTATAWAGVAGLLVLLALSLLLARRLECQRGEQTSHRPLDALFAVVGLACQQGVELEFRQAAPRLVLISALAGTFLVYTTYSAVLLSFMAVQVPELPFRSLEDGRAAGWRYATLNSGFAELSPLAGTEKVTLAEDYTESVKRFTEAEKVGADVTADFLVKNMGCSVDNVTACPVCVWPRETSKAYRGLAFRRDFPHYHLFNGLLVRMRASGTIQRLFASWQNQKLEDFMCPDSDDVIRANHEAIRFSDLEHIFAMLPVGIVIAFVVLIIERQCRGIGGSRRCSAEPAGGAALWAAPRAYRPPAPLLSAGIRVVNCSCDASSREKSL